MEFSSNTGMSFRTRLPSNSPRAGIRCSATHSRSKHERNVTQQPSSLHFQGFYGQPAQTRNRSSWRTRTLAPVQRGKSQLDHGALWHLEGQPDVLKNVQVVAQLHRQHLVTHLIGKDRRTIFSTGQVSIESESGVVEETRVDPTTSFPW